MAKIRTSLIRDGVEGSGVKADRQRFAYELYFKGDPKPIRFFTFSDEEAKSISRGIVEVTDGEFLKLLRVLNCEGFVFQVISSLERN